MKTKLLLFLTTLFWVFGVSGQVIAGQIDDFENGTTLNWTDGGSSVPPVNISTGGPNGAGDNYLSDPSLGGNGPGSKMVMFNDQQWTGNYTAQGIVAIRLQARALTNDLDVRIAFDGAGGRICTINAITLTANGPWIPIEIPISAADFTTVAGGTNIAQTLADVTDMRILSNSVPSWQGESIVATLDTDNIEAATTLSINDYSLKQSFRIIPNPSSHFLNISLKESPNLFTDILIYDIFGKEIDKIHVTNINTSIPISTWNSGLYFIKISNNASSQVTKFIKL